MSNFDERFSCEKPRDFSLDEIRSNCAQYTRANSTALQLLFYITLILLPIIIAYIHSLGLVHKTTCGQTHRMTQTAPDRSGVNDMPERSYVASSNN